MTLWLVFALMTAAAVFAVLWPLGRAGHPQQDGSETIVYRDQLTEIDRDAATGLINGADKHSSVAALGRLRAKEAEAFREHIVDFVE